MYNVILVFSQKRLRWLLNQEKMLKVNDYNG